MQPSQPSASWLKHLAIVTIVILVATGVSGYFFYDTVVKASNQKSLEAATEQYALDHSAQVSQYVVSQNKKLALYASREWVAKLLQQPTEEARERFNATLKEGYPEALDIALYDLDRRNIAREGKEPPSFVVQDMINRSERGEALVPEALRVDKQWRVIFSAPIITSTETGSNSVLGTLVITLPPKPLFAAVAPNNPSLGRASLLRNAPRATILIYQSGESPLKLSSTQAVRDSEWQIKFEPSLVLFEQVKEIPWLLILAHFIVAASLIVVAAFVLHRKKLRRDRLAVEAANTQQVTIEDVDIADEDTDILQLEDAEVVEEEGHDELLVETMVELPEEVFRAYDIRGKAESQISVDFAYLLGQAFASEALAAGESSLFVARDGRTHSPQLCDALMEGIVSTGCHVTCLGAVPTPLLYFATCEVEGSRSGIMVTASHNSAEYNGFKMVMQGKTFVAEDVQRVKHRMLQQDFYRGRGEVTELDIVSDYIERIFSDVALAGSVTVVVDAGNGITGEVAPRLLEELGCEVITLNCDIDGTFPNHDPDPTIVDNLQPLIQTVTDNSADLGIALDGDGDRLVLVTAKGKIIWPDRLLMLLARDIVSGNPGADVVFDVKSTRELNGLVSSYGGRPIMWKTGHSNMKTKMQETGALVGGEMSGHIFIKDRWYGFDDGMYAAARILEIMTLRDQDIDSLFESFPTPPSTPEIKIAVEEAQKFDIIARLVKQAQFPEANLNDLDGLRVEFPYGWGLVRASNTSPALTLRFEADTDENLQKLQALFKDELLKIDSSLSIPF